MITGIGVDIIEVARLTQLISRHAKQVERIFTPLEQKRENLAEVFAAKEAVLKVLGTGWQGGMNWTDVEIQKKGIAKLKGKAKEIASQMGITKILVATSSTKKKAIAQAIGIQE